jgi:hypothetical protein
MNDTDFAERKRPFAPVHRRSIELQQLDALLRIEEILKGTRAAPAPIQIDTADLNTLIPDSPKAPRGRRK